MRRFVDRRSIGLLLFAALDIVAQQTGTVRGSVVDPGGYPLPGASIVIAAVDSDRHYESDAERDGRFHVAGIIPGAYRITIRVRGFREMSTADVQIGSNTEVNLGVLPLAFAPCNTPDGPICDDFGLSIYNDAIHAQGAVVLSGACAMDIDEGHYACTEGASSPAKDSAYDFKLGTDPSGAIYIAPERNVEFALNPATTFDKQGCASASYSKSRVRVDGLPLGSRVCIKSKAGRYSQLMFDEIIKQAAEKVKFRFVTWVGQPDRRLQLDHR